MTEAKKEMIAEQKAYSQFVSPYSTRILNSWMGRYCISCACLDCYVRLWFQLVPHREHSLRNNIMVYH